MKEFFTLAQSQRDILSRLYGAMASEHTIEKAARWLTQLRAREIKAGQSTQYSDSLRIFKITIEEIPHTVRIEAILPGELKA